MNITIIKATYDNADKTSITLMLKDNQTGLEFPYTYIVDSDDNAPITKWLDRLYTSGDIHPDEYVEYKKSLAELALSIRSARNSLLDASDKYLTVPDYPLSSTQKDEIKVFRQQLRDITKQEGFPNNVSWPKVPDCIKDNLIIHEQ